MRNPNGYGSVYKVKGKRRKPYIARVTIGYDFKTGNQIRKVLGYFEKKSEALECLVHYNKNPSIINFSEITVNEIFERWVKEHYINAITKTLNQTNSLYKNHLRDTIGNSNIRDVKLYEVQTLFNSFEELSTSTKKALKSILSMAFNYALKNEIIEKNIIPFIDLGKEKKVVQRKIFTSKEINILWENKDNSIVGTMLILIYTGMRVMELLNLKQSNINLKENSIITGSKTKSGKNRLIPINYKILPIITGNMGVNKEHLLNFRQGRPYNYTTYRKEFYETLKELGIEEHTIHDCRHTFASLMSNAEANTVSISKIIGHSNYNITEKIYTHKEKEELQKAINLI